LIVGIIAGGSFLFGGLSHEFDSSHILDSNDRFLEIGVESPHWEIWQSTLLAEYGWASVFGLPVGQSIKLTGYTMHSDILQVYVHYGLLGFALIMILYAVLFVKTPRKSVFLALILVGITFRAAFDTTIFGSILGIPLVLLVLIALKRVMPHGAETAEALRVSRRPV
jgi:hypothetical protein